FVGQKNLLEVRLLKDLLFPIGLRKCAFGGITKRVGVGRRNALVLERKKCSCDVQKPRILDCVVKSIEILQYRANSIARRYLRSKRRLRHASGVRKLSKIMVTKQVIQMSRNRAKRVNVRMWIDQRNLQHGGKQIVGKHDSISPSTSNLQRVLGTNYKW